MAAVLFPESIIGTTYGAGYQLYFYEVGTTTDLTVYSDFALTTAHAQPIVADANGKFAAIYLDATGNDPKVVLHDASDVEIWTLARFPIEDITTLSATVATNTSNITALGGRITTNEADIVTLQTESADYESRITQNETDIATLQGASSPLTAVAAAFFVGQTNPSFAQNSGFSGLAKNADGQFDLTFTTARANANYIAISTGGSSPLSSPLEVLVTNKSTTGFRVETWYTTGGSTRALIDRDVNVIVYDLDA